MGRARSAAEGFHVSRLASRTSPASVSLSICISLCISKGFVPAGPPRSTSPNQPTRHPPAPAPPLPILIPSRFSYTTKSTVLRPMRSLLCRLQSHGLASSSTLARTIRPSPTFRRTSSSTLDSKHAPYKVFDRSTLLHHRDLAFGKSNSERSRTVGYLREEIGERVMERFEVRPSLRPPSLSQNRALTEHPWTWWGEQDVKLPDPSDENEGVDVLEITSGPGTFARLVEDDGRVRGVQMVESSGASLSPCLSTPQRAN